MEALRLRASSLHSTPLQVPPTLPAKPMFSINFQFSPRPASSFSSIHRTHLSKSKLFTAVSSSPISTEPPETKLESAAGDGKFDWYSQWYPLMPVCDLDKRVPHAKKVLGIDVVVWWDKNDDAWKVFDDACPHRLAPLSEGRIDQLGRLQCVYHGWCFNGSGDCKLIPQAPPDGPPVNTFKKACVAAYPSVVQHDIVWFWPSTDPQFKDIITTKRPPYMAELDDPSFTKSMGNRDIAYGYEVLIENLMDPAHVPYAHYGIMQTRQPKVKVDREGGRPLEIKVNKLDINGFIAQQEWGTSKFMAPCIFYASGSPGASPANKSDPSSETKTEAPVPVAQKSMALIFICVPVSPGYSRLIWAFPRNFGVWIENIIPRWYFHFGQNLILDSDLYLLNIEERKIMEVGNANWPKACFVPTKSDALVAGFRKWLNKYARSEVDWRGKYSGALPPIPPKEQLMDRYRSHVVNCSSCNAAYKGFKTLEAVLPVVSLAMIGVVAAMKQTVMSVAARSALVCLAILCFGVSRWLSAFIHKQFHFHDYNHAFI